MKKILYKIHLYLSIPVGLIISILCFTGAAMIFDADIHRWSNPHLYSVEQQLEKPLLISVLVEKVMGQVEGAKGVKSITTYTDKNSTYLFYLTDIKAAIYVNPYTGEVLGERDRFNDGGFYSIMYSMHRWLMDSDRKWGKLATGVSTIALTIILITGIIIWLPKSVRMLKRRLSISATKGWLRFFYDIHISGGIYVAVWLLLLGLTGLMWSFPWYRTGVYTLFGVEKSLGKGKSRTLENSGSPIDFKLWDKVSTELTNTNTNIQHISYSAGMARVYDSRYGNTRSYISYHYNMQNGDIRKIIPYSQRPESSRFMGWVKSIHIGSWGGMLGKVLTFIVAFVGGLLPLTGYYFWIKKAIARRNNRRRLYVPK